MSRQLYELDKSRERYGNNGAVTVKTYRLNPDGTREFVKSQPSIAFGRRKIGVLDEQIREKNLIKSEDHLANWLNKKVLPGVKCIRNIRPDWLKNPGTGRNLELDIYYPELNLAFEFGGKTHLQYTQQRRDATKRRLAGKRGITIIYVWWGTEKYRIKQRLAMHWVLKTHNTSILWDMAESYERARPAKTWRKYSLL